MINIRIKFLRSLHLISNEHFLPNKYLTMEVSGDTLIIVLKHKIFFPRTIFYSGFCFSFLVIGLFFLFVKTVNNRFDGFNFELSKILLAIIFLIIGFMISVIYIKTLFMVNKNNLKFNFLTTAENVNQILFAIILIFFIAPQITNIYN